MCPINSTATFQELEQFHNISCTEATSTLVQQALVTYATVNYMEHRQCSYQYISTTGPSYVRYSQLHET